MASYFMNEGAFDLPDLGFVDRTVHIFEAPGDLGLIVGRTRIPQGRSLRDLVTAHVTHEAKRLRGYAVLEDQEVTWAGLPAIDIRTRWRHEQKVMYQRQAHLGAPDTWLLFAMTAPLAEREACDRYMEHILTSFRLHDAA